MPSYKVAAIRGGPFDGQSRTIPVDCAVLWLIGDQMVPNSATVTASEIQRATALYAVHRTTIGGRAHDVLLFQELGREPEPSTHYTP